MAGEAGKDEEGGTVSGAARPRSDDAKSYEGKRLIPPDEQSSSSRDSQRRVAPHGASSPRCKYSGSSPTLEPESIAICGAQAIVRVEHWGENTKKIAVQSVALLVGKPFKFGTFMFDTTGASNCCVRVQSDLTH